ncbi:hypothetical protein ABZ815_39160, partial [Nonomuraea sp. NPDC047529]|uniref:hypothetical protein n=1 Tax=Nonomuraea sp. NPDC047529 TaxID=3155623 RepID=UPI00340EF072
TRFPYPPLFLSFSTRPHGQPASGGLPRVGRSLAALRLFGRSRPAPPTRCQQYGEQLERRKAYRGKASTVWTCDLASDL